MPATVADARDLLIASVLCKDPVMYIDDRWLYEQEDVLPPVQDIDLCTQEPRCLRAGTDMTIVGSGYATLLVQQAAEKLQSDGISAEIIDLRVLNPFDAGVIIKSVEKTRGLMVVDSGTKTAGFSAEVIASVCENIGSGVLKMAPKRITLPDAPAPASRVLERQYYTMAEDIVFATREILS